MTEKARDIVMASLRLWSTPTLEFKYHGIMLKHLKSTIENTTKTFREGKCAEAYILPRSLKQELFNRISTKQKALLGEQHKDTLLVEFGLGKLLRMQGATEESISRLKTALTKAVDALGQEHPVTQRIQDELDLLDNPVG